MTSTINALLWEKRKTILSSADRSEIALKAAASLTPEQRHERALKAAASLTPEQRSKKAKKAAVSRRKNLFVGVDYVERLPVLNLLSKTKRNRLYKKHAKIIDESVRMFRKRTDFGDIQGTADLAFFVALTKWDKKVDLPELIKNQIKYDLIVYFSTKKRHVNTEVSFDEKITKNPSGKKG